MRRLLTGLCLVGFLFSSCSDDEPMPTVFTSLYDAGGEGDSLSCDTGLPVLSFHTADGQGLYDKETWRKATLAVWTRETGWGPTDSVLLRGRGNATWKFPKKPFNLKFTRKQSLLGMPSHKRWVLLANYHDRTLLRNALTFHLGSLMEGLAWTPRFRYAEVLFNGHHVGNYLVCEQVRTGKNRVDIEEMTPSDMEGEALTGGYLLHFDKYYDEPVCFRTSICHWPVAVKSPDEEDIQPVQLQYIRDYVNDCEALMKKGKFDPVHDLLLDYRSFADYYIIQTLSGNKELREPRSVYAYKERGGPLCAGPLWDFDFSTYINPEASFNRNAIWYHYLFHDPVFVAVLKERWTATSAVLLRESEAFLDSMSLKLDVSQRLNFQIFPIRNDIVHKYLNHDEALPYGAALERMKTVVGQRIGVMDRYISSM